MAQAQPITDIQAELTGRVLAIGGRIGRAAPGAIAREIDDIRRIAGANGLFPAAAVAHALESALARGERGPLIDGWLQILSDAVGCNRHDRAACDTYTAACTVRLSA